MSEKKLSRKPRTKKASVNNQTPSEDSENVPVQTSNNQTPSEDSENVPVQTSNTTSVEDLNLRTENVTSNTEETKTEEVTPLQENQDVSLDDEEVKEKRIKKDNNPELMLEQFNESIDFFTKLSDNLKNNTPINQRLFNANVKKLQLLRQKTIKLLTKGVRLKKTKVVKSSGFMKPVKISEELCKFAGWDVNDTHSRIDVTNLLCSYIKTKNLQDPKFKKNIIPDDKLCSILNYDPTLSQEPLTYCLMQRLIQPHFIKS